MVTIMTGKIANPGPSGPARRLRPGPGAAELTTAPPALATSSRKPRTSSSWSASASDDGREASLSRRAGLGVRCGGVGWFGVGAKGGAESALEVVSCPDRDLPGAVRQAVTERLRPDTAVTVLIPEHHYGTLLDWALHDRTAQRLLHGLDDLEDGQGAVHLTVMPYHVGPRRRRAATTPRRRRQRLPAPRWATSGAA